MTGISVTRIDRTELAFRPKPWPFALARRAEIAAYFAALQRRQPAIWNGRVLLLYEHAIEAGVLRGSYLETDFASFTAWKTWKDASAGVTDCTAANVLLSADGAVLLGVMGDHTFNAGQIYFPCGTPDPSDIVDGRVDLEGSARRELEEETGIAAQEFAADPGWYLVCAGMLLLALKVVRASDDAEPLRARILKHLRHDAHPELSDMRIVRGPADIDARMPDFVTAFLDHWWRYGGPCRGPLPAR